MTSLFFGKSTLLFTCYVLKSELMKPLDITSPSNARRVPSIHAWGSGSPAGGRHCSCTVDSSSTLLLSGSRSKCFRKSANRSTSVVNRVEKASCRFIDGLQNIIWPSSYKDRDTFYFEGTCSITRPSIYYAREATVCLPIPSDTCFLFCNRIVNIWNSLPFTAC